MAPSFFQLKIFDMIKLEYNNIAVCKLEKYCQNTDLTQKCSASVLCAWKTQCCEKQNMWKNWLKQLLSSEKNWTILFLGPIFFRQYKRRTATHLKILCTYLSGWWIIDENIPLHCAYTLKKLWAEAISSIMEKVETAKDPFVNLQTHSKPNYGVLNNKLTGTYQSVMQFRLSLANKM